MPKVEFYKHNIGNEEIRAVAQVMRTLFLTTGSVVEEFERAFAAYLHCRHSVGLTSCTAALHLGLLALGVGPGDEVITTPLTFVATANAILHAGAKPVFVDVEPAAGTIDPDLIRHAVTKRTKAILPVHLYGQMCDMREIRRIAQSRNLTVIEDVAHAPEAMRDGVRPGQLSDAACFSFYATKSITCGEGGALATNDTALAKKVKILRLHGMDLSAIDRYTRQYRHWDMKTCGWKYNMSNIQAAPLRPQLKRMEAYWRRREIICRRYEEAFSQVEGIDFPRVLPRSKHARHLFTIWVSKKRRDGILRYLQKSGIGVAVNYRPVHLLTFYRKLGPYKEGMYPIAEQIGSRTITLPLYPRLTDSEVSRVIRSVTSALRES